MKYLKNVDVEGDDFRSVEEVKRIFGHLYFEMWGEDDEEKPKLRVKAFRNNYAKVNRDGILYVLVPEADIKKVWPDEIGDCDMVRYGTTSSRDSNESIKVLSIQLKDGTGLLFCLDNKGSYLKEKDSFGV